MTSELATTNNTEIKPTQFIDYAWEGWQADAALYALLDPRSSPEKCEVLRAGLGTWIAAPSDARLRKVRRENISNQKCSREVPGTRTRLE